MNKMKNYFLNLRQFYITDNNLQVLKLLNEQFKIIIIPTNFSRNQGIFYPSVAGHHIKKRA